MTMNPSIQKIIAEAQKRLKQGNRKGARQILGQAVQHYPREAHLWYWLGQTLDDRKHAIDAFERALSYDPSLHQAQKFLDRINAIARSSPPTRQPSRPSRPAPPKLPAKKAPSPAPAPPPPQKEEKEAESESESEMNLDWLMNRTAPSAAMPERQKPERQKSKAPPPEAEPPQPKKRVKADPPPHQPPSQEDEGSSWSFLEELSEDDLYIEPQAESMPEEASQPASSGSSFLEELQEDNQGTSLEGEKAASASASPWDFLTDDLVSSNIEGTDPAAPPLSAPENAFGISEDELWRRAQAFIGDVKLPESLSPENQAAQGAKIERGAFTFSDAPPSLAAQLPVRSDLPPLTEEQIKAALGAEPAEDKADKQEKAPKQAKPRRGGRLLGCLLLLILLPVVFGSLGWYLLRGSFYPTSLEEVNPELISTQVAELQIRYLTTAATPIPAPDWVGEAQELRYQNNFAEAEARLRAGLEAEAGNSIGLATLSDLLRERLGREGEALSLAQEASAAATTAEERARASESYVWALAHQAQPDVGQALASAEQALEETPESPHTFWALAMARALAGNADGSREALISASALSEEVQAGAVAAQEAEVYARMGELEEAVALYERALRDTDYIPWRVELVKIERKLEHPDSQTHLDHLREIAPDDPAVQQLGQ